MLRSVTKKKYFDNTRTIEPSLTPSLPLDTLKHPLYGATWGPLRGPLRGSDSWKGLSTPQCQSHNPSQTQLYPFATPLSRDTPRDTPPLPLPYPLRPLSPCPCPCPILSPEYPFEYKHNPCQRVLSLRGYSPVPKTPRGYPGFTWGGMGGLAGHSIPTKFALLFHFPE